METVLAMGTGWLLATGVAARQMWPDSWLHGEPFTAAWQIAIGFFIATLVLGGVVRRRVRHAESAMWEEVDYMRYQRDQWMRSSADALRTGIELGTDAGYDRARREFLRRRRLAG